ncbi:MAG: Wzz/FepE/Etk N-terminal domain-containing protein [Bacteroidota bacterium]|nr:Wzz/FepE/Etk N-terminal domain-containing protein [Bacteroidota bacterium]MDP4228917.1 Wzz/FepE/Etk N-terminal domain-containing protein [Bacteroidota bacterium]MDP4235305.1 Wzz/FepE/Etk N-terminal domain-containing protein [Bacteroidota bacterium]
MTTTSSEQRPINPARRAWIESVTLLFRYKWLIILTTVIVTAGTAVYLFGFAKIWYKAEANVVPARKAGGGLLEGLSSGISSTIKDLGITPLSGKGKGEGIYSPIALVASREVQEKLVTEFNFVKIYEAHSVEDADKEFGSHVIVDIGEEGNISISFEDTDPVRAANVANRLVEELNAVNSKLAIEEAKFNRTYIEQRYSKLLGDLDSAERALGDFQKKYGVYELKAQAAAQLSALGLLEQQRYSTEIELSNAEQLYGTEAAETNVLRSQLNELKSKLDDLKTGMDRNASSYFVPMNLMPDVALDYLRLTREVEIQSKLKAYMLPTYEQAKLDETKLSLSYLTLDKALPPTKKSRPKRSMQLLMAMLGSFAVSSLAVIGLAAYQSARARFRRDKAALGI